MAKIPLSDTKFHFLSASYIFVNKLHIPHIFFYIYDSVFRIFDLHSYSII